MTVFTPQIIGWMGLTGMLMGAMEAREMTNRHRDDPAWMDPGPPLFAIVVMTMIGSALGAMMAFGAFLGWALTQHA